ncbi:unnamed protein product [Nesidiocoris tenuis]|uniref:Uncharacterized protein n=1 Tax=Nesidiocoris tenuis TaxID=355587 RepID=A0A6H5HSG4_9HEMI|nr:unnamed protein product [Nesidiocoris tenuis]CAB0017822.1 unnamed protein product [Nesidiocoris tenuis]
MFCYHLEPCSATILDLFCYHFGPCSATILDLFCYHLDPCSATTLVLVLLPLWCLFCYHFPNFISFFNSIKPKNPF